MAELLYKPRLTVELRPRRTVKSFTRRQGYITASQRQGLVDNWSIYGLGQCNFQQQGKQLSIMTTSIEAVDYELAGAAEFGSVETAAADKTIATGTTFTTAAETAYTIASAATTESVPVLDFSTIFCHQAPVVLEIGFGDGASLLAMARAAPELNFIGVEVYSRGVMQLIAAINALKLKNIRILATDAVDVLQQSIPDGSLAAVNIFFPDPWPKTRHHKRRLVQPEFVALIAQRIAVNGKFYLATDWYNYAQQMLEVLEASPYFNNAYGRGQFAPRLATRIVTKYEAKAKSIGRDIWDLCFQRH